MFENIVWLTNNTSFHIKSSTYCNISLTVGVSHKNGIFKNIVWLTNNTCDASTRFRPLAPLLIGMSRTWTKMNHSESLRLLSSFYDHIFIIKNLDIFPILELLQIPLEVALRGGSAGQYKTFKNKVLENSNFSKYFVFNLLWSEQYKTFNTKFWKTQISQNILFSTCCEAKRKECCFHPRLPPEYPTHLSKNIEVIIANNKESFAWKDVYKALSQLADLPVHVEKTRLFASLSSLLIFINDFTTASTWEYKNKHFFETQEESPLLNDCLELPQDENHLPPAVLCSRRRSLHGTSCTLGRRVKKQLSWCFISPTLYTLRGGVLERGFSKTKTKIKKN